MVDEAKTFMVENAEIFFRNFSGKSGKYSSERNFCVVLDEKTTDQMIKDDWNVKFTKPREEGDNPIPFIPVAIRFDIRPPRVVLITSHSRTQLDEDTIEILDWVDINTIDLIARGHEWNVNGKTGTKAYLQSLFVTIEEDALERKYQINENLPAKN